ncbi:hypothetical protein Tco_1116805 [Tanacetum coccineum]
MKSRDFNKDSIDTFYNSLNQSKQDSLNSAANGNFLTKNTQEALTIIENKSKVQTSRNKTQVSSASGSLAQDAHVTALTKQVEALLSSMNCLVNSLQNGCETCSGPHAYYECQAADGCTQEDKPQGALPSNTTSNSQADIKAITTQSGIVLDGPSVSPPPPFSSSKDMERDLEMIIDQVPTKSTIRVPPLVVQSTPAPVSSEIPPPHIPSSFELPKRNPHQPPIPYPSRLNKDKLQDKSDIQIHKFLQMFKKLHFNITLAEALALMPKYHKMSKDLLSDKEKLLGLANTSLTENCSAKNLSLPDLTPTRITLELATREALLEDAPALVDVYEEELILRDEDEKLIFHADSTSKHPHKHGNESINMINFIYITCEDHELALLDPFPLRNEDDNFDPEADLRKIEYLLNQDPSIESSPNYDIEIIDSILKRFTDEPALVYSPLLGYDDDDDDDLFHLKSDYDEWKKLLYGDNFNDIHSGKVKIKDSKIKILINELESSELNVLPPQLLTSDPTLPEESSESSGIATLSSSPFENEDKVFNPGILILGRTQVLRIENKAKNGNFHVRFDQE